MHAGNLAIITASVLLALFLIWNGTLTLRQGFQNPAPDTSPGMIGLYVAIGVLVVASIAAIPWMLRQGGVQESRIAATKDWQKKMLSKGRDPFGAFEPYPYPRPSRSSRSRQASKSRKSRSTRPTETTPLKSRAKVE